MGQELSDLSFADILTFLAVVRHNSLSGAARELDVTPSQVSKAVSRLERQLHARLLSRGGRGVMVSDAGRRIMPHLEDVVNKLRILRQEQGAPIRELTVGAPSYLSFLFLPTIAQALPDLRLRALEHPPSLLRAYAGENLVDVTLTVSAGRLPPSWSVDHVGDLRRGLYVHPGVAKTLGKTPISPDRVKGLPLISPVLMMSGQFVSVDDGCPLNRSDRMVGHEVSTIALALELAAQSNQGVFGPSVMARSFVERGVLVEVPVTGWAAREPLYVGCNMDRVLARVQNTLVSTVRARLDQLQGPVQTEPAPSGRSGRGKER